MSALIIGAGIAGPVLGTFLARLGMEVTLCEARPSEALAGGAFLGVAPNGMHVLRQAGAAEQVLQAGTPCSGFEFWNAAGERIAEIDGSQNAARYGEELVMIRRAELHQLLLRRAQAAGVRVRFGARLSGLEQRSDEVLARFADSSQLAADFLVGCDGLRSQTRALALPQAPAPKFLRMLDFAGYGRAPQAPLAVGKQVMVFGRHAFFGAFRRPDGEIWWFHNGGDREPRPELSPEAHRARLLEQHAQDPDWIQDVIRSSPELLGPWPLHDLLSIPRWHAGRVCLIGDAAHATSPSAGQGASLALEDALTLARCLRERAAPEQAFAAFEAQRRQRVEKIVRQSRFNGSPKVARSALGAWARDRVLPLLFKLGAAAQREQYGYRADWEGKAA